MFEKMGLPFGSFFMSGAQVKDTKRVKDMTRKSAKKVKLRRKKLRGVKKGYMDKEKEFEGCESYSPGNFM